VALRLTSKTPDLSSAHGNVSSPPLSPPSRRNARRNEDLDIEKRGLTALKCATGSDGTSDIVRWRSGAEVRAQLQLGWQRDRLEGFNTSLDMKTENRNEEQKVQTVAYHGNARLRQ